ncbi:sigma-54-dependent Fis family transcriptional regulator [Leminorella grimontii]|uniref:Sigma-54-dependent Fis family transcriptional regulator n=1 Tax=Leminorella grimontii TaxID=82981 RepID=A0AAV5N527_9GAMM|nr:sigma-54 dependent transcriptional regulator [Leminorella grimontii]KFC96856.1 FleQ family flagellar regulatory protein [Leminorella grimontii ATCC 33999 = DSM 5078]GKX56003.1 sigma-54-dependent Fis family transcriptional regulator [Leminorella grimontii]VFS57660.1 Transcriptional regulatory protein ZraR [Leminorella grimontii]
MPDVLIVKESRSVFSGKITPLVAHEGLSICVVKNVCDVERCIKRECPSVIFFDMNMLHGQHIDFSLLRSASVIMLTDHAATGSTLRAIHINGPENRIEAVGEQQLRGLLSQVKRTARSADRARNGAAKIRTCDRFGSLYGRSPLMRHVYEQIACVAPTNATVLIVGESGTGKEQVAQTIHTLSARAQQGFIPINCGAISAQLVESELFGHEKGSFTGADSLRRGLFEQANGGTLFLDEVTEMSSELQVKFLRVLETGSFMRVGSSGLRDVDARIIAATNAQPEKAVASGKLREDLYYRLNVFPIQLPPLRERREDIPILAEHFLQQVCKREGRTKRFLPSTIIQMCDYDWPGNVRELRNAVQRGFIMSRGDSIGSEWRVQAFQEPDKRLLIDAERELIFTTLERFHGHREKTAAALGVSLKTLYNRLKKYGTGPDGGERR